MAKKGRTECSTGKKNKKKIIKNQNQRKLKFYISGCQNTPQMEHNRYTVHRLTAIWQQAVFFFSQTKMPYAHSDAGTHMGG